MTDSKDARGRREPVRVIDRRMFTPEGERRHPEPPPSEEAPAGPAAPEARPAPAPGPAAKSAATPAEEQEASAQFLSLIRNLATTAAANLGEIPNPFTGRTEVDLEGARQVIDLLQALRHKTRGNLSAEESRMLDALLYDLRVAAVSVQKKAARPS